MRRYSKVVFFNWLRNGDIHVSRSFVRLIIAISKERNSDCLFEYAHNNPAELLEDIREIESKSVLEYATGLLPQGSPAFCIKDVLYVNTWYAANNRQYLQRWGLTFDCLYFLFEDILRTHFDVKLSDIVPDPRDLFPVICSNDMSDIDIIDSRMGKHNGIKKILVCNGPALSGQAKNVELLAPTLKWAKDNLQDYALFATNETDLDVPSINLITTKNRNLLQIGYIAKYFDIIIGRASGPSTFCITRQTLFEQPTKQILSFISPGELFVTDKIWLGEYFASRISYDAMWIADYEINLATRLQTLTKERTP